MIRLVIKTFLLLVWCLLAAFLISMSVNIFAPAERLAEPSFWGRYMGTAVLMMLYVGMINKAYNEIIADKEPEDKVPEDREAEIIGLANYLLFALVPPIGIHCVLFYVAEAIGTKDKVSLAHMLFNKAYWQQDFVFLLLPLLLTALFFYYRPQYRLCKGA